MSDVHYIDGWPQPYRLMDAQPYWDALEEKQLTYQRCGACNHVVWPAHGFCTQCGAPSLTWQVSSGRGKIYSFSTVVRGPTPTWQAISPYTVGFVEMEEAVSFSRSSRPTQKTLRSASRWKCGSKSAARRCCRFSCWRRPES